jgi:hypothetical protein
VAIRRAIALFRMDGSEQPQPHEIYIVASSMGLLSPGLLVACEVIVPDSEWET